MAEADDGPDGAGATKVKVVKLCYFAGFTFEEAAVVLGIAVPTAKQWWGYVRAWLRVEIAGKTRA